ncbi:ATP-dependent RNA helicase dbp2 [Bienertia sinuspersici]
MTEPSVFDRMMINLRQTCRYYTGYPKDLGPSRVIHFSSERQFVQLLHQGYPVVVAFTIRGNYTKHLDKVLEEAAAEFYPHVKFMRAAAQGKVADPNVTKYSVKVLPFNHDVSAYGFREFFKRHGIQMANQD